jgi:hypothetical protein
LFSYIEARMVLNNVLHLRTIIFQYETILLAV